MKKATATLGLLWLALLLAVSTLVVAQQSGFYASASTPVSSAGLVENSWVPKAPMHQARMRLGVAVVNGKIYAIGGDNLSLCGNVLSANNDYGSPLSTNEMYDPETDTWTTKASMPTPRTNFGVAVYQDKIYCIGGLTTDFSSTGVNEVYDPATDTWETKMPMPTPRHGLQANLVDGRICLIGGYLSWQISPSFKLNEVYDPETDSWITKTPMPHEIYGRSSAVLDDKIYVLGGWSGKSIQIYDTKTDSWDFGAAAPSYPLSSVAGVTTGVNAPKRIYLFDESATQVYYPANDSWSIGISMPTARGHAGVAVVNDSFYVVGGVFAPFEGYIVITGSAATNEQYIPWGYGIVLSVVSPESNKTYAVSDVPLTFNVSKTAAWTGYSLDGQENVTITGNTTLFGLSNGSHNVTVFATDAAGNTGASETITFTVAVPFPTIWIAATVTIVATAGAASAVYYFARLRKQRKLNSSTIA